MSKAFLSQCVQWMVVIFGVQGILEASCPSGVYPCDEGTKGGYLGNVGATGGNCATTPLPPLCAFGSLSVNQNAPLDALNRLNPQEKPTTNNFQNFQSPCAIYQTVWENGAGSCPSNNISAGGGDRKLRMGPFLVGMTRTGPCATLPLYNMNQAGAYNANPQGFPQLVTDTRTTIFMSATECTESFFDVSTEIPNSETCIVTYTPLDSALQGKFLKNYNIMGNFFHDVYYENLTPVIGSSINLYDDTQQIPLIVDQGAVQFYNLGDVVTGKSFQFFLTRTDYPGGSTIIFPATLILFAESTDGSSVQLKLPDAVADNILFTFQAPFTGFLRLAPISNNDPGPTLLSPTWSQASYFMPENLAAPNDTSNPPATCAIEDPACGFFAESPSWWNLGSVSGIAPTGLNFYMLFPNDVSNQYPSSYKWAQLFTQLAYKMIGPNWTTPATPLVPDVPSFSNFLPVIALSGYAPAGFASSYDLADQWYSEIIGPTPLDKSTNAFLLQFDMCLASYYSSDVTTYQNTDRPFPIYPTPIAPNNAQVYADHSRYIPVKAEVTTTDSTITWTYTLSDTVTPLDGKKKVLVAAPFWKYASDPAVQNFIYNDTIKGTFYGVEADENTGEVTFSEKPLPTSWYGTVPNLYFPNDLYANLTQHQKDQLNAAITVITSSTPPLPYFDEKDIIDPYDGGKKCYMLAKTGFYLAYYLDQSGGDVETTRSFIEMAKSILTAYLVARSPGTNYFVADQTTGGICTNGAGGIGSYANGPNLQQSIDSGIDFGNYVYNDHHFFAGYYLNAAAMITSWEMLYNSGSYWVDVEVMGADNRSYQIKDLVDFLWRDVHSPFTNDPLEAIYDLEIPYNRFGLLWEGHSVASGFQYIPRSTGRNQESIGEDFNCWVGMNTFSRLMLALGGGAKYTAAKEFSDLNLGLTATGAIQWFKNSMYWKGENMFQTQPTFLGPSIHIGQYSQATVTSGQIDDADVLNQAFF